MFDNTDRTVLTEEQLASHFYGCGFHRNLVFREEWQSRGTTYELNPGDAVRVPTTCPHWMRNGDRPSVSLSISFKTNWSQRRGSIYKMNARLRRLGLDPKPFGQSEVRDAVKFHAFRMLRHLNLVTEPEDDRGLGAVANGGRASRRVAVARGLTDTTTARDEDMSSRNRQSARARAGARPRHGGRRVGAADADRAGARAADMTSAW